MHHFRDNLWSPITTFKVTCHTMGHTTQTWPSYNELIWQCLAYSYKTNGSTNCNTAPLNNHYKKRALILFIFKTWLVQRSHMIVVGVKQYQFISRLTCQLTTLGPRFRYLLVYDICLMVHGFFHFHVIKKISKLKNTQHYSLHMFQMTWYQ